MFKYGVAALLLTLLSTINAASAYVITDNRGGTIRTFELMFGALRATGEPVVIDGLCASACTLAVSIIPKNKLCVTPRAILAFHQAWDKGTAYVNGQPMANMVPNKAASEYLFHSYPQPVRDWIFVHGGLPPPWRILKLRGKELRKLVRTCDAQAEVRLE